MVAKTKQLARTATDNVQDARIALQCVLEEHKPRNAEQWRNWHRVAAAHRILLSVEEAVFQQLELTLDDDR